MDRTSRSAPGPHTILRAMTISGVFGEGTGWVTEAPRGHTAVRGCAGIRTQPVTRCMLFSHSRGWGSLPTRPFHHPTGPSHSAFTRPVVTSTTSTSGSPRLQLRLRSWQVLEVGFKGATGGPANRCSMVRV